MVVDQARQFDSVAISAPNRLVIRFKPVYALSKTMCERPEQAARFEQALAEVTGQPIRVEFALVSEPAPRIRPLRQGCLAATAFAGGDQAPVGPKGGELFGASRFEWTIHPP